MTTDLNTSPTHWLDIMPAIPLAVGLPVIWGWDMASDTERHTVISVDDGSAQSIARNDWNPSGYLASGSFDGWRVDLDDPQGFGYALRVLGQAVAVEMAVDWAYIAPEDPRHRYKRAFDAYHGLVADFAVLRGQTTDADRLALAQALAEVMS